jgi:hypothetical protein
MRWAFLVLVIMAGVVRAEVICVDLSLQNPAGPVVCWMEYDGQNYTGSATFPAYTDGKYYRFWSSGRIQCSESSDFSTSVWESQIYNLSDFAHFEQPSEWGRYPEWSPAPPAVTNYSASLSFGGDRVKMDLKGKSSDSPSVAISWGFGVGLFLGCVGLSVGGLWRGFRVVVDPS